MEWNNGHDVGYLMCQCSSVAGKHVSCFIEKMHYAEPLSCSISLSTAAISTVSFASAMSFKYLFPGQFGRGRLSCGQQISCLNESLR